MNRGESAILITGKEGRWGLRGLVSGCTCSPTASSLLGPHWPLTPPPAQAREELSLLGMRL